MLTEPKILRAKVALDDGHGRRVFAVLPGEAVAGDQGSAGGTEVVRRDAEHRDVVGSGFRWRQVRRLAGEHIFTGATAAEGNLTDEADGLYAGNRLQRFDHALLHGRSLVAAVTGHAEIGIGEHDIAGIEAEAAVDGALEAAQGNQRGGDQHSADGNLHGEQDVAEGDAAASVARDDAGRSGFDDEVRIGAENLANRDCAEEEAAGEGEEQGDEVDLRVGVDRHMHGILGNGVPDAEPAQERDAAEESNSAAGERNQDGFGEQRAHDAAAGGTESKAQSDFTGAVGGTRGK